MHNLNRRVRFVYFVIDIAAIALSFFCVFKLNPGLVPQDAIGLKLYISTYLFWAIALIFSLHSSHLYFTDRYLSISREWAKVAKCVLTASILAALFIFVLKISNFSRTVFVASTLLLLSTLSAWRALKRITVRYLIRKGYANFNVLIAGAGKMGLVLAEEIQAHPYLGIRIVGFIDDLRSGELKGIRILGKTNEIDKIVKKFFIDEIYVTIPSERRVSSEIIREGARLAKTVRVVSEHFDLPYSLMRLNYLGAVPLLTYFENGGHGADGAVKRFLDILVSGLVLILLTPLLVLIACWIKAESPGPVLYISKRSGKKGAIFDFYKFRSMHKDADNLKVSLKNKSEVKGPIFKIRNDPRLTRVGRLLRKYSLDELPQLINVLKGDMSLVGPRPFPIEESQQIEYKYIPRLNIRPGITGLAQVKGRSDLTFSHWMRWDSWYLHNWSLGLDIKIILWTIPVVLKGKGAY